MRNLLITFFAAAVMLSGCSKLSKDNYDKISMGMPYNDVVELIGKPATCKETMGMKSCEWKSGDNKASIAFIADKVTVFSSENLK